MLQSTSMIHVAALAVVLAAPAVSAQERGEEILGKISQVNGMNVVVKRENGPDVRIRITPQTQVEFRDSGDRKLFPNPSYRDLRPGMGVRFVYGTGTPDRIVVVYVPSASEAASEATSGKEQVKARIVAVNRGGREIRADVAGTERTYPVEGSEARAVRRGDLVVLTIEPRTGGQVVTRIDRAEMVGTVTRVDSGRRTVTIEVDGQEQTYDVDKRDLLDGLRSGQRVRFEVEERSNGRRVVTTLRRD